MLQSLSRSTRKHQPASPASRNKTPNHTRHRTHRAHSAVGTRHRTHRHRKGTGKAHGKGTRKRHRRKRCGGTDYVQELITFNKTHNQNSDDAFKTIAKQLETVQDTSTLTWLTYMLGKITGGHQKSVNDETVAGETGDFVNIDSAEVDSAIRVRKEQLNVSITRYVNSYRNTLHEQTTNWQKFWHWCNTPTQQDTQVQLSQNGVLDACFTEKYTLFFYKLYEECEIVSATNQIKDIQNTFPDLKKRTEEALATAHKDKEMTPTTTRTLQSALKTNCEQLTAAGQKILAEQQKIEKASANLVVLNKFEKAQDKIYGMLTSAKRIVPIDE